MRACTPACVFTFVVVLKCCAIQCFCMCACMCIVLCTHESVLGTKRERKGEKEKDRKFSFAVREHPSNLLIEFAFNAYSFVSSIVAYLR